MTRRIAWIILLVLTVPLAACTAATGTEPAVQPAEAEAAVGAPGDGAAQTAAPEEPTTAVEASQPEREAEPTAEPTTAATATATAVVAETPPVSVDADKVIIDDNRSDRLRALTDSWGTDWARRTIDYSEILSGGPPRDGIPSIDDPTFVSFEEAEGWLAGNEPVIALELNGDARAYPLQVMTWHEIANDEVGGVPVVVTFCPLCNSALVFDSRVDGQVFEFGVSGLLRNSDLIMYDRTTESLWQQFTGEGIVGEYAGAQLTFLPSQLVSFDDFRAAFPDGTVLSRETGFNRPYGRNPYAGYDTIEQPFLFRGPMDDRLPPIARVVTVSLLDEGVDVAYPLETLSDVGVINDMQGGTNLVVFHQPGTASALGAEKIAEARDVGATGVFRPTLNGQVLTFAREGDQIIDSQTGSVWNVLGQAIDGELAGEALEPVVHGDHFWFSWAAFRPDTIIYGR